MKQNWSEDKRTAYEANEVYDPNTIKRLSDDVVKVLEQYKDEDKKIVLELNADDSKKLILTRAFLGELEKEWPIEDKEIRDRKIAECFMTPIYGDMVKAYVIGHLVGKGFMDHKLASNYCLCLGDSLSSAIRSRFPRTKGKGLAYGSAYVCVMVAGSMAPDIIEESHAEEHKHDFGVTEYEILTQMIKTVHRDYLKGRLEIGKRSAAIDFNPFDRSDKNLIHEARLGIPPWSEQRLKELLIRVLKTKYSKYYEEAKPLAILKSISKGNG